MNIISGLGTLGSRLFNDSKGPWGPKSKDGGASGGGDADPPSAPIPGPWGNERPTSRGGDNSFGAAGLDAFIERNRRRFGGGFDGNGGGGGGGISRPSGSKLLWIALGVLAIGMLLTTMHRIGPEEKGVVTLFGRYNSTLQPGITFTLPVPIARVQKVNVSQIRDIELGSAAEETMMLTGDQNIINLAYAVRWKIKNPELFLFELSEPEQTVREVGESSMRAEISKATLDDAIGPQRAQIAEQVRERMQEILDSYRSGIEVRGVDIKQADPPAAVDDAFKDVSAAQQDAQQYLNQSRSYAQQLLASAQGAAAAFEAVYAQYKLAPEVTRKRMYFETMESVLSKVDKTVIEPTGVQAYLPLPELKRRSGAAEPSAVEAASSSASGKSGQ